MVLDDFLEQEFPLRPLLRILALPKSSYYYQPTGNKAGKRPVNYFYKQGDAVSKEQLLTDIQELLSHEFVDYGYYKTYIHLKQELGYAIGSSRTYSIMKEHNLLKFQRDQTKRVNRNWVKELVPVVNKAFEFLEFDIKFVYIQGEKNQCHGAQGAGCVQPLESGAVYCLPYPKTGCDYALSAHHTAVSHAKEFYCEKR